MSKTFREVIRDIKIGEVWVSDEERISKIFINEYENLQLEGEVGVVSINGITAIGRRATYTLERPQYTFTEAFAEYECGAEIESVHSGNKYSIQHGGCDCVNDKKTNIISFWEIRNKWYINKEMK